jgi:hypothetical protein
VDFAKEKTGSAVGLHFVSGQHYDEIMINSRGLRLCENIEMNPWEQMNEKHAVKSGFWLPTFHCMLPMQPFQLYQNFVILLSWLVMMLTEICICCLLDQSYLAINCKIVVVNLGVLTVTTDS